MTEIDFTFHSMGSDVRFLIGPPLVPGGPPADQVAEREREFVLGFARRLSRFREDSELSHLNADSRREVPASTLLRAAVEAALWAAERTGGLVDSTLIGALERNGYSSSLDGARPASLTEALASAPPRQPARPHPAARWREVAVSHTAGSVIRPPGILIDTGGTGKGLCADAVAFRLRGRARFLVDCGGDIAVGGVGAQLDPYEIQIEHPLSGRSVGTVRLGRGGVATSGLNVRIWRDGSGRFRHHLLDPSTGQPAWTGLIGVTAAGESALEAETLAKQALLSGPPRAREVLRRQGGVLIHDSGHVETVLGSSCLIRTPDAALA